MTAGTFNREAQNIALFVFEQENDPLAEYLCGKHGFEIAKRVKRFHTAEPKETDKPEYGAYMRLPEGWSKVTGKYEYYTEIYDEKGDLFLTSLHGPGTVYNPSCGILKHDRFRFEFAAQGKMPANADVWVTDAKTGLEYELGREIRYTIFGDKKNGWHYGYDKEDKQGIIDEWYPLLAARLLPEKPALWSAAIEKLELWNSPVVLTQGDIEAINEAQLAKWRERHAQTFLAAPAPSA